MWRGSCSDARLPAAAEALPDATGSLGLSLLLASVRNNLGWKRDSSPTDPWGEAVRTNVSRTTEQLLSSSLPIRRRVDAGRLTAVGAIYKVETGDVEFLEDRAV